MRKIVSSFSAALALAPLLALVAGSIALACGTFQADDEPSKDPLESGSADVQPGVDAGQDAASDATTPRTPEALAESEGTVSRLAVHDGALFWARADGTVRACRADACEGSLRTIAAAPYPRAGDVRGIAADDTYVYWTVRLNSVVFRAPITGMNVVPEAFAEFNPGGNYPQSIALDSTTVYWTSQTPDGLRSCPIAQPPCGDAGALVLTPSGHDYTRWMAINTTAVFWVTHDTNDDAGVVFTTPKNSSVGASAFVYDIPGPRGIAVVNNAVFVTSWLSPNGGNAGIVYRKVGTNAVSALAKDQSEPTSIAADSLNVYWANRGNATIQRCAIGGCNLDPSLVATSPGTPDSLVIDDTAIYWVDSTNGAIIRLLK